MSHPPLYREVLRQAWRLTWHERLLWVLGLFSAALVSGGAVDVLARHISWSLRPPIYLAPWRWGGFGFDWAATLWLIVLLLLLLGLAGFLIFMAIRSFICLVIGARQYEAGKKLNFEALWHEGAGHFWPVLGTVFLAKGLIMFLSGLTVLPLVFLILGRAPLFFSIIYFPLFLAGVLASVIVSFLMIFTVAFLVLEKQSWKNALLESWRMFAKHWLVSLEMAILILVVDLLTAIILAAGALTLAAPAIAVVIFARFIALPGLGDVAVFVGSVVIVGFLLLVGGFLGTFHTGSWVLLFDKMKQGKALSKLVRIVEQAKIKIRNFKIK